MLARSVHVGLNRIDHIVVGEFNAVTPVDAAAQLYEHCRSARQRAILPHTVNAPFKVDVPELSMQG
jgi:hypothetical protein